MGGFEFLNLRGLWLLAGALPLVLLYVLKVRRDRYRVPSTWLWASAHHDLLAKSPFRRLVAELPLILQLLALAALALALAEPSGEGAHIAGDHIAIIVDTSGSMATAATGDTPEFTRMHAARAAAMNVVDSLEPSADAFVLEAGREPRVLTPLERDARHLKQAIEKLSAQGVEGDLAPALALAADRLRSLGGRKRIVVVTDGALADKTPLVVRGVSAEVVRVGEPRDNVAIVRIDVRSGVKRTSQNDEVQAFVMVRNYAKAPKDIFVTLTVEGHEEPIASRRVLVPSNEKVPVVMTFEPGFDDHGRTLVAQISPHDALPVDDIAFARVPEGRRLPVALATRSPGSWIGRALQADNSIDLRQITIAQLGRVNIEPDALVVIEGACPTDVPGRDLVIAAPPAGPCFGVDVGQVIENPLPTSWRESDPRLRFLTFDGVHISKAKALTAYASDAALLRSTEHTLIADASLPGRAITLIAFDPSESDWPLTASFVLFVRNIVEVARLHRAQGASAPARTGDAVRIAVPTDVKKVTWTQPSGEEREVDAKGGFAILPPMPMPGVYRVNWSEPKQGEAIVAANLTSETESDIEPHDLAITSTAAGETVDVHEPKRKSDWWRWLAVGAAVFLVADLLWLTRRARKRRVIAPKSAEASQ